MISTQEFSGTGAPPAALSPRELKSLVGTDSADVRTEPMIISAWPSARIVWTLRLLCAIAFGVSCYLSWVAFTSGKVAGCGGGLFDCEHVLKSKWSTWFGAPVGAMAAGMYAVCLTSLAFTNSATEARRRIVWQIMTVAGLAAGLAGLWFISLQVLVIGHLCPWCLTAHTCGLLIAGIILWKRPAAPQTFMLATLSVLGIGVLVGGQLVYDPPTYEVERYDTAPQSDDANLIAPPGVEEAPIGDDVFAPPGVDTDDDVFAPPIEEETEFAPPIIEDDDTVVPPTSAGLSPMLMLLALLSGLTTLPAAAAPVPDAGTAAVQDKQPSARARSSAAALQAEQGQKTSTQKAAPAKPNPKKPATRIVTFRGGSVRLNVRHWPLVGNPNARYVFVEMFDYTCPHCRNTHRAVEGAFRKYGDNLAIVALPVPLDSKCNPSVRVTGAEHAEACELARIAVAVWRSKPSAFTQFHNWMFDGGRTRTATEARRYGEQLVGRERLAQELAKPYAAQYIAKHIELYNRMGAGAVPKLLFPRATMVGEVSSPQTLCGMIERELGQGQAQR